jgi:Domain of unknown function (DUF4133)
MDSRQTFTIHKGVNRPLEFKGLQGRYLIGLAGTAVGTLVGFGVLHAIGINSWLGVLLALGGGGLVIVRLHRLNRIHGQYGRMKRSAQRALPKALVSYSRKAFIQLYSDGTGGVRGTDAHFGGGE